MRSAGLVWSALRTNACAAPVIDLDIERVVLKSRGGVPRYVVAFDCSHGVWRGCNMVVEQATGAILLQVFCPLHRGLTA